MRLTRSRFTIRDVMFAVAVCALLMGVFRLAELSGRYQTAAEYFASLERWGRGGQRLAQENSISQQEWAFLLGPNPLFENKVARAAAARTFQQAIDYCAAARRRYERAAARPWLPLDSVPWPSARRND